MCDEGLKNSGWHLLSPFAPRKRRRFRGAKGDNQRRENQAVTKHWPDFHTASSGIRENSERRAGLPVYLNAHEFSYERGSPARAEQRTPSLALRVGVPAPAVARLPSRQINWAIGLPSGRIE